MRSVFFLTFLLLTSVFIYSQNNNNFYDNNPIFNIEMIFVKGGSFMMGCTIEQGNDCFLDEEPIHEVTLSNFYIAKYEVTQELWVAVMGANPSRFKGAKRPVENVSWSDVQEFIRKLNELTGKKYRLPTEAEWEFAASGGRKSTGKKYSGRNVVNNVAWYSKNSRNKTRTVGLKAPNELGIYDMSGNVWEWCSDWYGDYSSEPQTNPKGAAKGSYRVIRGGCCSSLARYVRVTTRGSTPDARYRNIGFRLVANAK
ncbi:MAG: formylglycine-generating enzyme family protein [Bacteroidetes bacterium]|nr:formylglycine-generating enzyme family protein [Bacteroidota bacterium]